MHDPAPGDGPSEPEASPPLDHDQIVETLRAELDRTTPKVPEVFDLPLAEMVTVKERPAAEGAAGEARCGAKGRSEAMSRLAGDTVAARTVVVCTRPAGHDGPHRTDAEAGLVRRHHWQFHQWT